MDLIHRNLLFILLLLSTVILLPGLAGTGMIALEEGDEIPDDDDFSLNNQVYWMHISGHSRSMGLVLGMSIFALVVVYRGGRSNRARFNDRTLDSANVLIDMFSGTALNRAVFVFLYLEFRMGWTNIYSTSRMIPNEKEAIGKINSQT